MPEIDPTQAPNPPTVLIADDMSIVREPIAASLRAAGYDVVCASDGREAVALIQSRRPQLILLDLNMPSLDGLDVIRAMNAMPSEFHVQVILLTADSDRTRVIEAARLGVKDYILKRSFSFGTLLERVARYAPLNPDAAIPAAANAASRPTASAAATDAVKNLLTRDECIARAEKALQSRALSGVVMQVAALAASPSADLSQIASFIARDPMLSARVLQVANSAAYGSARGPVTSVTDAVKNIGCNAVHNIAAALGIFDAVPATTADGFDPIRGWQHSFAVAQLCERLVAPADEASASVAYLIGLCHDLADIFFHTHFAAEYNQVLQAQAATGFALDQLEREMMGITRDRLLTTIIQKIGLPESISGPIESFHEAERAGRIPGDRMARILRLADRYACGLLLAPSGRCRIAPLTRSECRAATGAEDPARPESVKFRNEILALTGVLARLSPADEAALLRPLFGAVDVRLWVARDAAFSSFDPVTAALEAMGRVDVHDRLPLAAQEWTEHRGLVVIAKSVSSSLNPSQLPKSLAVASGGAIPCLWGVSRAEGAAGDAPVAKPTAFPIALEELAKFIRTLPASAPVVRKASA